MCGQFILSVSTSAWKETFNSSKFNKDKFLYQDKGEVGWRCESLRVRGIVVAGRKNSRFGWHNALPNHAACGSFGDKAPRRYTHR